MPTPSFFIVRSLACQAACKYCFGPHKGAAMDNRTARGTLRFIRSIADETAAKDLSLVFHKIKEVSIIYVLNGKGIT